MDEFLKIVGSNIKRIRKEKGISQNNLSRLSFLSRTYLSKLEKGLVNVSLGVIYNISMALKVDPYTLLIPYCNEK